jgi:serine/threonine protein kinase
MVNARCTLAYATPEVVLAWHDKQKVKASEAHDIWALGVMVFEALCQEAAIDPFGGPPLCVRMAQGKEQYPWEGRKKGGLFWDSRARDLVKACLARDPSIRPPAAEVVQRIRKITYSTLTMTSC